MALGPAAEPRSAGEVVDERPAAEVVTAIATAPFEGEDGSAFVPGEARGEVERCQQCTCQEPDEVGVAPHDVEMW